MESSPKWEKFLEKAENTRSGRRNVFDGVGVGKKEVPVRNLKRPMEDVAIAFIEQRRDNTEQSVSKSWLKKNVPRHIKPPVIESFACPFCKGRVFCGKHMNKM